MASSKEYLDFIMEQLSGLDGISCRAMMGEYILYHHGRIAAYVCDDRLFLKELFEAIYPELSEPRKRKKT